MKLIKKIIITMMTMTIFLTGLNFTNIQAQEIEPQTFVIRYHDPEGITNKYLRLHNSTLGISHNGVVDRAASTVDIFDDSDAVLTNSYEGYKLTVTDDKALYKIQVSGMDTSPYNYDPATVYFSLDQQNPLLSSSANMKVDYQNRIIDVVLNWKSYGSTTYDVEYFADGEKAATEQLIVAKSDNVNDKFTANAAMLLLKYGSAYTYFQLDNVTIDENQKYIKVEYSSHINVTFYSEFATYNTGNTYTKDYRYGEALIAPDMTVDEGYQFLGYDQPVATNVWEPATYTGNFERLSYLVTFLDINNDLLEQQSVYHGENATAPNAPKVDGKEFVQWDLSFDNVKAPLTISPIYKDLKLEEPIIPVIPTTPTDAIPPVIINPVQRIVTNVVENTGNENTTETKKETKDTTTETIKDNETPLAGPADADHNCFIHIIMFILTLLFAIYGLARVLIMNKERSKQEETQSTCEGETL